MRVFLPNLNIASNAQVLSPKSLNSQIGELAQIYSAITGDIIKQFPKSVPKHPETLAYRFWPEFLLWYGLACCAEYHARNGIQHALHYKFIERAPEGYYVPPHNLGLWLRNNHRAGLYRKDNKHYNAFRDAHVNEIHNKLYNFDNQRVNLYPVVDDDKNFVGYKAYYQSVKRKPTIAYLESPMPFLETFIKPEVLK